jgi:hypothetical protein
MRSMKLTLLFALTVSALAISQGVALAAHHPSANGRHRVSISVSENPIVEGQPIVIYGHLVGQNGAGRTVTLYHRSAFASDFTPVQQMTTDTTGYYAFTRLPERILTNREWYVRSLGARSATVHEHVYAQVTLTGSIPAGSTIATGPHNPATFSGSVTPASVGQPIVLQRQDADGGESWHTIQRGRVGPGGQYSIVHEFRYPGDANIRVLLRRDGVNIASPSSVLSYEIEQAQNPALTLQASQNPIVAGESETISGTLAAGPGASVTLYARQAGGTLSPVATVTSGSGGSYAFPAQTLQNSTYYQVRSGTTESTLLFVGVKYILAASATQMTIAQGQPVTLTGSVTPAVSGHVIDLQEQAPSGQWVTIERSVTAGDSTFVLTRPLFKTGALSVRAFIPGGPSNQGTASTPLSITVTPVAPALLPENTSSENPEAGVAE